MYLATPKRKSTHAILVLHSWWGLNPFFHRLCDRFAEVGFVALGADLYNGKVANTAAGAQKLRRKITATRKEPAYKYLIRMIDDLQQVAGVDAVGVVGFSMGGHWAFWLAQQTDLPIVATVTFYAARNGDFSKSRASFLAHFADRDDWVSDAVIKKLERNLSQAGRAFTFHSYPGTSHWFFEEDRKRAYDPNAAALAWQRTTAFLKQHLSG